MRRKGFIGFLALLIVALALLKYFFDWSIFEAATSEQGRKTVIYIKEVIGYVSSYFTIFFSSVWNKIIWPVFQFIWPSLQTLFQWGRTNASQP